MHITPIIDLGCRYPNEYIPCFCPFHQRFQDYWAIVDNKVCLFFWDHNCSCKHNTGKFETKDDLIKHCFDNNDVLHTLFGHYLEALQYWSNNDNDNNGEGVARMPNYDR